MTPIASDGRHPDLLSVDTTVALLVDVQEGFRPHIDGWDDMVATQQLVLAGLRELGVPVIVSEQYPEGLGTTATELAAVVQGAPLFSKLEISSCDAPGFATATGSIDATRTQWLVMGIETHVCVSQTVHGLLTRPGARVHVVADAVGSRDPWQREMALERLARAGATITTAETALFELLSVAGTPQFKAVQRLIKQHDAGRAERAGGMAFAGTAEVPA